MDDYAARLSEEGAGTLIFVAAGTQDGREIVRRLCAAGYDVAASVVSSYGEQLLSEQREAGGGKLLINDTPLDEDGLAIPWHSEINRTVFQPPAAIHLRRVLQDCARKNQIPALSHPKYG